MPYGIAPWQYELFRETRNLIKHTVELLTEADKLDPETLEKAKDVYKRYSYMLDDDTELLVCDGKVGVGSCI
jgi:hypothetical protein